jgi:acyl-CoA synthetase (AMP-forming)/AMP-acid ligase II
MSVAGQSDIQDRLSLAREAMQATGSYFEIGIEDVRGTPLAVFKHRERSLSETLEKSTRFPDRSYIVEGDRRIDFRTHLEMVNALAASLQKDHGLVPGARVGIFGANRWEWVVAFWAVASAGGIPCAYNGFWTTDEAAYATRLVEPALLMGDRRRLERIESVAQAPPLVDFDDVGVAVRARRGECPSRVVAGEDDPAVLIFTSGTTGRPRAVTIAHRGLCGSEQVNAYAEFLAAAAGGANVPQASHPLPVRDDVVLATSPLFHTSMLFGVVLRGLVRGTTAVLLPGRFDPQRVLETIERERVTSWLALGNAAPRVCSHPDRSRYDTSSLTHIGVGGSPVSPATQQAIVETFPQVTSRLSIGYSSTEAVSVVASLAGRQLIENPTSTGRAAVTVDIVVRDPAGNAIPDGELGEVHVRSPYIMLGYWNDAAATADALKPGGWLAMGDVGRKQGALLYIDTRARDLILVNAENVSPAEVEHRLEAHPDVVEAAVFAVDDATTGDAVCAVVVANAEVNLDILEQWCRAGLAPYKVPTRWFVREEELPRTASGKLIKDAIRMLVGEERGGI